MHVVHLLLGRVAPGPPEAANVKCLWPLDNAPSNTCPPCTASSPVPLHPQVHLTYWSDTSVLVSWATCGAQLRQTTQLTTSNITSVVFYGSSSSNLDQRAEGVATSYAYDYKDKGISYASPVLHHVLLKGKHTAWLASPLAPGRCSTAWSCFAQDPAQPQL